MLRNKIVYFRKIYKFGADNLFTEVISFSIDEKGYF